MDISTETSEKPIMFMLCGLPASGKSMVAENIYSSLDNTVIHSSDSLRSEMFGDERWQDNNEELFAELHKRIKNDLRNGKNIIYDATNINQRRRKRFLSEIGNINCKKICLVIASSYYSCLEKNKARERSIPNSVITNMLKSWMPPSKQEGFDEIQIIFNVTGEEWASKKWDVLTLFTGDCGLDTFEQNNSHHSMTLGKHCREVSRLVQEKEPNNLKLQIAALLHDEGKIFTKSPYNFKKEKDGECHYYRHNYVGAYNSMFYAKYFGVFNDDEILHIANLVYYHMLPYDKNWCRTKSQQARLKEQLGEQMFHDLMILHEADVAAH